MEAALKNREVLVIGAGLIGALIANKLANTDRRVTVVDAHRVAQGATRRAIGLVTPRLTQEHLQSTTRGVDSISTLAMSLGVPSRSSRVLHLASTPAGALALHEFCSALNSTKPKLTWETKLGLVPVGYDSGIIAYNSLLLDAEMLTTRLLRHVGIKVYEDIEIQKLEYHEGRLSALAHGHTVRTDAVVLATNAYAGMLSPYLADAIHVVRTVTWSSRPIKVEDELMARVLQVIPIPLVIDHAHMMVAQNLDGRLRVSAWSWDSQPDDPGSAIRLFLRTHLPELLDHTEEWRSGAMAITQDGAPLVGKMAGDGAVLYALGAGADGAAWAPLMADHIVQLLGE
jgi:glycine/D-amino acid oxidase-like deaminating enzyme